MDCTECKEKQRKAEPIPFIAYETGLAMAERTNKRTWVLCIILAVALIASWIGFIVYEAQFEAVTETMTSSEMYEAHANGNGIAINNGDGEVVYGGNG